MYAGINAWRWINGVICMFGVAIVLSAVVFVPETYPSVLLRKQARRLEKETGRPHVSVFDVGQPKTTIGQKLSVGLRRPFVFLVRAHLPSPLSSASPLTRWMSPPRLGQFCEPIVLLLSLYTAVIFGILYICAFSPMPFLGVLQSCADRFTADHPPSVFAGFPVIFQSERGWSQGVGALPFVAMAIGLLLGVPISIYCLGLYRKAMERSPTGRAEPEERLYFAMVRPASTSAALSTADPPLPFSPRPTAAGRGPPRRLAPLVRLHRARFGPVAGIGRLDRLLRDWNDRDDVGEAILRSLAGFRPKLTPAAARSLPQSIMSYLSDTYTIYAASVFAGNSLLRYILGAAFPLYARVRRSSLLARARAVPPPRPACRAHPC